MNLGASEGRWTGGERGVGESGKAEEKVKTRAKGSLGNTEFVNRTISLRCQGIRGLRRRVYI